VKKDLSRSNRMTIDVLIFTLGMMLTKISSFLINIIISAKYGAGYVSDAIIISISIPTIIFSGFVSAVSLCFVPIYKGITGGQKEKNVVTSNVLNNFLFISLVICLALFVFPKQCIRLLASGMSFEGIELAGQMTRWIAIGALFCIATGLLQGFLQANNCFKMVSISALPVNVIIAASILISNSNNLGVFVGVGGFLAYFVQNGLFLLNCIRTGFKWTPRFDFGASHFKELIKALLPILASIVIYDINTIVDKNFASVLTAGTISVLDYAYKIAGAAQGIIAYPLTTIIFTRLSELSIMKKYDKLQISINEGLQKLSFYMIPIITLLMVVSDLIVKILFMHGEFSIESTKMTTQCMVLYLIGMYAISYRAMLEKVFMSMKSTRVLAINALITVSVNILLNAIFVHKLEHNGLALATSMSMCFSVIFLWIVLKRYLSLELFKETKRTICKVSISSILTAAVLCILKKVLLVDLNDSFIIWCVELTAISLIGCFLFFIFLFITRETIFLSILRRLKK
jgi:putative peptidoglycan lipid II flippase